MDPLLKISLLSQDCQKAEKKLAAAKRALGLLNRLNAQQIAQGKDISVTAQRIRVVFGKMNALRADVIRAKDAYNKAIDAVNLMTVGSRVNATRPRASRPLPGLATATALMERIQHPA